MSTSILRRLSPPLLATLVLAATSLTAGCPDDLETRRTLVCGDAKLFAQAVSPYVEKRCGSLDCHGAEQRPLRVLGELGLRHPLETNVAGGVATTPLEHESNVQSFCGLEPEKMEAAIADYGASVDALTILQKPRGIIDHKGGKVLEEGDAGDRCIAGWVGKLNVEDTADVRAQCEAALAQFE